MVEFYRKKYPESIKWFPTKNWEGNDFVIDINSEKVPSLRWQKGIYDIEPEDVIPNAMSKEDVLKMKFKVGILFDVLGNNKGMLLSLKKKKVLIKVDKSLVKRILSTAIGFEEIKEGILDEYKKQKEKLDAKQS